MPERLTVNPIACTGRGFCAELLPEYVHEDDWGYPVLAARDVAAADLRDVKRAIRDCPALALRLARRRG